MDTNILYLTTCQVIQVPHALFQPLSDCLKWSGCFPYFHIFDAIQTFP